MEFIAEQANDAVLLGALGLATPLISNLAHRPAIPGVNAHGVLAGHGDLGITVVEQPPVQEGEFYACSG